MNHDQLRAFLDSQPYLWYNTKAKELARNYRILADQDVPDSQRLWYLAKAQGIDELLDKPNEWLKISE